MYAVYLIYLAIEQVKNSCSSSGDGVWFSTGGDGCLGYW